MEGRKILLSLIKKISLRSSWKSPNLSLSKSFLKNDSVINNVFEFLPDYWITKTQMQVSNEFYKKAENNYIY